jgi:hypothetical protein
MGQLFLNFIYRTVKLRDKGAGLRPAQHMVGAQETAPSTPFRGFHFVSA